MCVIIILHHRSNDIYIEGKYNVLFGNSYRYSCFNTYSSGDCETSNNSTQITCWNEVRFTTYCYSSNNCTSADWLKCIYIFNKRYIHIYLYNAWYIVMHISSKSISGSAAAAFSVWESNSLWCRLCRTFCMDHKKQVSPHFFPW